MKNPINEAKKLLKKIESFGKDLPKKIESAKKSMSGHADYLKKKIDSKANEAVKKVDAEVVKKADSFLTEQVPKAISKELPKHMEKAFAEQLPKHLEKAFADQLPELLKKLVQEIASGAIKPTLKAAGKAAKNWADGMDAVAERKPKLVDQINQVGYDIELKFNVTLELEYKNFWVRSREIAGIFDRYGNEGIKLRRRDIVGFIRATGADAYKLGGGAELSLGVDIGGSAKAKEIPGELFCELADYILEKMGVPA